MTKKELVKLCAFYLEEPQYKVNKIPKDGLEYLYDEVILPDVLESNMNLIDID